jgi:hypothetical protein
VAIWGSLVVVGAAHMGVAGAAPLGCGGLGLVAPIGQHVADMRVFAGALAQCDGAGALQSGAAVALTQ